MIRPVAVVINACHIPSANSSISMPAARLCYDCESLNHSDDRSQQPEQGEILPSVAKRGRRLSIIAAKDEIFSANTPS